MRYPIERRKHTPEEQLQLLYVKKYIALLNLELQRGHITKAEFKNAKSRLEDRLAACGQYAELQQYIDFLQDPVTDDYNGFDYLPQLKFEESIIHQSFMTSLEPQNLPLPDSLRHSGLELAHWELRVLEKQIEEKSHESSAELQLLCAIKLIMVLNLEVDLSCIQKEDCGERLEEELAKPGYCSEVQQYLQEMLYEMTDKDTSNYWGIADGRRTETEHELLGEEFNGKLPEDDPRYPMLEDLRQEFQVLKCQLVAI